MIDANRCLPHTGAIDMTRMPKLLFVAGLVAAALLVAGCTSGGDQPPANGPTPTPDVTVSTPPAVVSMNESMNGSTIAVPLNSTITLELNENPTTGYSWNLTTTAGLQVVSDEYIPGNTSAPVAGAGGIHRWAIASVGTGLQEINGVYVRPWETGVAPVATFFAEVSVTP